MKKIIMLLATIAMSTNVMAAAANGKGSDTAANDKGSDIPDPVVKEMCESLGYEFGPGSLDCNRNWLNSCEEVAGTVGVYACNLAELPVNLIKIPVTAVGEGLMMAQECYQETVEEAGPLALVFSVPCLVIGGAKGVINGAVNTVRAVFEVRGDAPLTLSVSTVDENVDWILNQRWENP
ncbi:MAG: hypothetical protein KDD58_09240 [Bdellovibrionales bacterium]|nr:hypothetical protein [Bdellovibrionales bacterium]